MEATKMLTDVATATNTCNSINEKLQIINADIIKLENSYNSIDEFWTGSDAIKFKGYYSGLITVLKDYSDWASQFVSIWYKHTMNYNNIDQSNGMPNASGGPSMPNASGEPSMPNASGGPSMPNASGEPGMPNASGGPSMPNASGGPGMPNASGEPSMPNASGGPGMPNVGDGNNMEFSIASDNTDVNDMFNPNDSDLKLPSFKKTEM